jgi:LuxR family maltose regulon positive regulatory protein
LQERENQLRLAAQTYRRILELVGDKPLSVSVGAYIGLARISYEWNDLDSAEQYGQQAIQLARYIDSNAVFAVCKVLLARLRLAQGKLSDATSLLAEAEQFVRQHNFSHTMPEIIAYQVITLLRQGNLTAASNLVVQHDLPVSRARVYMAEGDTAAAITLLESHFKQVEAKGWASQGLRIMVLQAIIFQAHGDIDSAIQLLSQILALTEPEGFIRLFVDEDPQMAYLLLTTIQRGISSNYISQLLAAFSVQQSNMSVSSKISDANSELIEPLTEREIEVLHLIAKGLTNQEIATKLFLSPHTVKVHARNVNGKLGVHNRTQAVTRARALGILSST